MTSKIVTDVTPIGHIGVCISQPIRKIYYNIVKPLGLGSIFG